MDWNSLAKAVIGLGAPLLGQALGGPLGSVAGQVLANALGATEATPDAVNEALARTATDEAAAALAVQQAETQWAAALAEIGKSQVSEVAATQRAEIASSDPLQRSWRPLYALELSLIECPAFALTLLHALWLGHEAGISGFVNLSGLLMAYFGARFGVLGIYVSGRSREKQAALTGEVLPTALSEVTRMLTRRR